MARKYYHEVDPPANPNSIWFDRQQPMRDYFEALGSYDCSDCNCIQEVIDKYPNLDTETGTSWLDHRLAVEAIWTGLNLHPVW